MFSYGEPLYSMLIDRKYFDSPLLLSLGCINSVIISVHDNQYEGNIDNTQ